MHPDELIRYLTRRTRYKARQVAPRYPALGDVEDIQHDLIEDVLRRLPRFNGERAGVKTFICLLIHNKIASMIKSHDAERRGYRGCRGRRGHVGRDGSLDDWVRDETGSWVRRDAALDAARSTAPLGVVHRSAAELSDLAMDAAAVMATLSPEQRELCVRLQTQTPTEVSRETGVSRSTLYQRIAAIRDIFAGAELHLYVGVGPAAARSPRSQGTDSRVRTAVGSEGSAPNPHTKGHPPMTATSVHGEGVTE